MGSTNIDALVAGLKPVRRLSPSVGLAMVVMVTGLAAAVTALGFGLRADLLELAPPPIVLIRSCALLLVGIAAARAVVSSARPGVGERREKWLWSVALWSLLPLASLVVALRAQDYPTAVLVAESVPRCLGISLSSGLAIGAVLIVWLRQGAVTQPTRAGWLVGLAAGGLGTFAYNLHCPSVTIHYAALWYSLTLATGAVAGRLIAPRFLRW